MSNHSAILTEHNGGHDNIKGMGFMLLNTLSLSFGYAVIGYLMQELAAPMLNWLYKFLVVLFFIPYLLYNGGLSVIKTNRIGLHMLRAFFSVIASVSFYHSMKMVLPSDAHAIRNLNVVLLSFVGIFMMNEKFTVGKISALFISFLGVLWIVCPDLFSSSIWNHDDLLSRVNVYYLLILISMIFWVLNHIIAKILTKTERSATQMFYITLFPVLYLSPPVMHQVIVSNPEYIPSLRTFIIIVLVALSYMMHSNALFKALKFGELSVIAPFQYFSVIFLTLFQYLLLDKVPDYGSFIGYILIISSSVYLVIYEKQKL